MADRFGKVLAEVGADQAAADEAASEDMAAAAPMVAPGLPLLTPAPAPGPTSGSLLDSALDGATGEETSDLSGAAPVPVLSATDDGLTSLLPLQSPSSTDADQARAGETADLVTKSSLQPDAATAEDASGAKAQGTPLLVSPMADQVARQGDETRVAPDGLAVAALAGRDADMARAAVETAPPAVGSSADVADMPQAAPVESRPAKGEAAVQTPQPAPAATTPPGNRGEALLKAALGTQADLNGSISIKARSEAPITPPVAALPETSEAALQDLALADTTDAAASPDLSGVDTPVVPVRLSARETAPLQGRMQNLPTSSAEAQTPADSPTESAASQTLAAKDTASGSANPSILMSSLQAQIQGQSLPQAVATADQGFDPAMMPQAVSGEGQALPLEGSTSSLPQTTGSQLAQATFETTALISAQILRKLEGRTTRFDMALTPDDLGRVDVSLSIESDGQVTARLAFDNPAAATDLRGRADELRRQLAEAGLNLARENLEFTDRNPHSGSGQGAFGREQDRRAFAGAARLNQEADLATSIPALPLWAPSSQTPDRVDVKV